MLTQKDRETQAATGLIPTERVLALKHGLPARRASISQPEADRG